jgi:hypothetical protein
MDDEIALGVFAFVMILVGALFFLAIVYGN